MAVVPSISVLSFVLVSGPSLISVAVAVGASASVASCGGAEFALASPAAATVSGAAVAGVPSEPSVSVVCCVAVTVSGWSSVFGIDSIVDL